MIEWMQNNQEMRDCMKLYMAPLEGITGYTYRNAYHTYFAPADKYFTPFLTPHTKRSFNARERKDLIPEHNQGMYLVPQVLTKSAEDFVMIAGKMKEFGYQELNLNAGCPSGTVASKGRGAGLLEDVKVLDNLLAGIFTATDIKVSVKTRLGMDAPEEFYDILEVYNKYPLEELIIHPRVREDYYKNQPNYEMFSYALTHSTNPVVYNGDLFTIQDVEHFCARFPQVDTLMLGRGLIGNPGLIGQIRGQARMDKKTLLAFHNRLVEAYNQEVSGDKNVLYKMKELWFYMGNYFTNPEKYMKRIKKTNSLDEYRIAVEELFRKEELV